jgi:GT2 family glycosyltransferase
MSAGWLPLSHLKPVRQGGREFYESPAFIGCAFAMSRELYDKLHGFDSHMFVWGVEDVDLALRSWLMGHPILHDPAPRIGHRFRRAFDNYVVPREHVVANQIRMAHKKLFRKASAEKGTGTRRVFRVQSSVQQQSTTDNGQLT